MEKVYDICCGIDVHKKLTVACLRNGRQQEIRQDGRDDQRASGTGGLAEKRGLSDGRNGKHGVLLEAAV